MHLRHTLLSAALLGGALALGQPVFAQTWSNYAGNAQHTALSSVASQALQTIRWQAPVDLNPQYSGTSLLIHYGSPLVTNANTVLMPVKTGATGGFKIQARNGGNGALLWEKSSDYVLPAHSWVPSFSPTLAPTGRLYFPGASGTVYFCDNVDSASPTAPTQVSFYGNVLNSNVKICTPLTSDSFGNVYFGFRAGTNTLGLTNGLARIGADGSTSFLSAATASGDANVNQMLMNCAPAVSNDGKTLYMVTKTNQSFGSGYLVALDATTLAVKSKVLLKDPKSGQNANLPDDGTASPMVAPDGKVYFGVLENPFNSSKGWLLQFDADLNPTGTPGAFGWDDTPSLVPASMVPSYNGTSDYLLMTKYNNYAGLGGDGVNKLAILDPNATQIDSRTGATVMKEVLSIAGITPDPEYLANHPDAVREWCINTAVVDPATKSILANSEDGRLYRWDLTTNTFTQSITLTAGIGEAYTPTLLGRDGTVYAINNATLFAVGRGAAPEPATLLLALCGGAVGVALRRRR